MNPFVYSSDNKRYHTLAYHNRALGCKRWKASIDLGFTCPNIDGSKGTGGCIFCDGGSRCFSPDKRLTVTEQLEQEWQRIQRKISGANLTAYFQANSNTYAPLAVLRPLFEEALAFPAVQGLSIATRPDCLVEETLDYLADVARRVPLTVELGLQTASDETAGRINRCYVLSEFLTAQEALCRRSIRTCVHIIDGLPGEGAREMLETARLLGDLRPEGVKIHLLHVLKGTKLAELYGAGEYCPMEFEAYIDTVVSQLELLAPETVIERLTGDGDKSRLLAPFWSRDKIRVLGGIDKRLQERDTWQGRLCV